MLTGKRFRLTRSTTGIQLSKGTVKVISVPAGGVVRVLPGPNSEGKLPDKGIVYTLWEERTVALFAVDLEDRGTEVRGLEEERQQDKSAQA